MGKGSYLGGSTLIRPWNTSWFGTGSRKPSAGGRKAAKASPQGALLAKGAKPKKPKATQAAKAHLDPVQEAGLALLRAADKPKAISRIEKVMLDRLKPQSAPPSPKAQARSGAQSPPPPDTDEESYATLKALDRALDASLAMIAVARQRIARAAASQPRNLTPREARNAELVAQARSAAARQQALAARKEKALARAGQAVAAAKTAPAAGQRAGFADDVDG